MSEPISKVCVLTIGDELLSGEVIDSNHGVIASAVRVIGLEVVRHLTVSDDLEEISDAVRELIPLCDVLITTGGLGPTNDDLTCAAISKAIGVELEFHPHLESYLRRLFESYGREMPPENIKQAYLPAGASEIPTAGGTAPGFLIDHEDTVIISLPGVPSEVFDMIGSYVIDALSERFKDAGVSVTKRIMCFGAGESDIATLLTDRIGKGPVRYGFLIDSGSIVVKLTASGSDRDLALSLIDKEEVEVKKRLGPFVYSVDGESMEEVVGRLLKREGLSIALAESVTAGMAASRLANVPGSSEYLLGGIVAYSQTVKTGILRIPSELIADEQASVEVAEAMATSARRIFSADMGLATTGVAGPGGGDSAKPTGTVAIALAHSGGVSSLERRLPGGRQMVRNIATLAVLNMVRLHILYSPGHETGGH